MPKRRRTGTIIDDRLDRVDKETEEPPMRKAQEQGVDYSAGLHKPSKSKEEVDSMMKSLLEDLERRKKWERENGLR